MSKELSDIMQKCFVRGWGEICRRYEGCFVTVNIDPHQFDREDYLLGRGATIHPIIHPHNTLKDVEKYLSGLPDLIRDTAYIHNTRIPPQGTPLPGTPRPLESV